MRLILTCLLLLPAVCGSAPFLVADPYPSSGPQPDSFSCVFDSGAAVSIPATANTDGSKQLHYDLAAMASGPHTAQCAAVSTLWGSSAQSGKLSFSAGVPAVPSNLGLSAK